MKNKKTSRFKLWSRNRAYKKGYDTNYKLFNKVSYVCHKKTDKHTLIKRFFTNNHYQLIADNGFKVVFDNTTPKDKPVDLDKVLGF